ncbi:MAG TPA: hypothetical protein VMX17_13850 [Candidatus Glassbacteria bacterium]|nr:hypothetical protein [Candidatus Glassbacteria bacterium]
MKDDTKSSIIKEAFTDYSTIMEAANANAKKRLAEEFPENFNKLLKEEIIKNKSAKESYKKLDEAKESDKDKTESNKESDMKNQNKETSKVVETVGKGKPFDKAAPKVAAVKEDVKITDTVGKGDPFDEKPKGVKKIDEEREKDFMGDVENDTPNQGKGELEKGDAFKEKLKGPSSGKPLSNIKEEFDISELDMGSVGTAMDGAGEEDEIITIDEIEAEISQMQGLGEELSDMSGLPRPTEQPRGTAKGQGGDAFTQLSNMRNQIDEMLKGMEGYPRPKVDQVTGKMTEMELQPDEMSPADFQSSAAITEEETISDEDIDAVLGAAPEEEEVQVDEHHGVSFSAGTITPGKLGDNEGSRGRFRKGGVDESKKIGSLIEENKKLTKKLNETKKFKESVSTLVEQYKGALEKYRNQLKEMAVFNTNLAHVNNLLVNESLALTQDDKIKIINEFKKVESIAESQKRYKSFLTEMKESKKTLTESIEGKVSASIQPSSKQKLDEVVEKTAYANDKHIQKMRNLIEYVENRGKKIIK